MANLSFDENLRTLQLECIIFLRFHYIICAEYHTQMAKLSFDESSNFTAGVYFMFTFLLYHMCAALHFS